MPFEKLLIAISSGVGALLAILFGIWMFRRHLLEDQRRLAEVKENAEREARVAAREEALELRAQAEVEIKERSRELERRQEKLELREASLDERFKQLDDRERQAASDARDLADRQTAVEEREKAVDSELAQIAALDKDQARNLYLTRLESEFREAGRRRAREIESEAILDAESKAKRVVLDALHRSMTEYVTEATVAVVELPSEDMKGRIIGREGRNIRAFEQTTGVDLIIDDTPEAVVISSFDPVRRETARITLMNLMADGRIHPSRIEELFERASQEVERMILDAGQRAADAAGVHGIPPRVLDTLGRLRFRTSYGQNVLDHSVEVSRICQLMADELGYNVEIAKRAGLLHDIGKALGPDWEGPHAIAGMNYLRAHGEKEPILLAVGAHHHEIDPTSPESLIVIAADSLSAARPGARRESLDNYLKRLSSLEQLALSFPGVERSYAVQAGREVRLLVKPEEVDDVGAARLANQVAQKIESDMVYPGQIKVTVIRETRAQGVAR
jgi:ribonucrease Y